MLCIRSSIRSVVLCSVLYGVGLTNSLALEVNITKTLESVTVQHDGQAVKIQRNQDTDHQLSGEFTKTSRPCPPFCFQPMHAAEGVETLGEIELIQFIQTQLADGSGLLVDSRVTEWYLKGTIPGAIHIPFTAFDPHKEPEQLKRALKLLGVEAKGSGGLFDFGKKSQWNFKKAKTIALFCNGPWCGQSPTAIHNLIALGYPPEKLKYYRGGMQLWELGGFTLITPKPNTVWK